MNKRIFLTSILAISFAMPAVAEITSGATCDTTNLGQSENNSTANVEATWTPNIYRVSYECLNGIVLNFLLETNECDTSNPTSGCVTPGTAVYGAAFNFADASSCRESGYTFANWSCTDSGGNTSIYGANEQLAAWNIDSDLTCVELRTANTINIDWNPQNGEAHTTNTCTYGETITLPTEPTKTGYTFNGWLLHDDCADLTTQNACNMNAQCAWDTTNTTCVNLRTCKNTSNEDCTTRTFCSLLGMSVKHCTVNDASVCSVMQTPEQCATRNCTWNSDQGTCRQSKLPIGR